MTRIGIAAFAAAAALTISGGATAQPVEPCKGPFAKCVKEVGGWCEPNGKGGQTINFYGKTGYSSMWEDCVGKVYQEHGRPDPYRTTPSQKSGTSGKRG